LRLLSAVAFVALLPAGEITSQELNRRTPSEPVQDLQPAHTLAKSRSGAITGRVVTDSGQPLANASVYLRRTGPDKTVLIFTTDEGGRFNAEDLQAGAYVVAAYASGYVTPAQPPDSLDAMVYRPGDSVNITLVKGGVIAGRVTDARAEPVAGLSVRPIRVRDLDGKPLRAPVISRERLTDDRGIYRLYGLDPGIYIVAAASAGQPRPDPNPYEYDTPTYYPSGTRDSAIEIRVEIGMEAGGIDIKYRESRGHSISGAVTGLPNGSALWVTLNYSGSNLPFATVAMTTGNENRSFAISGIPVGEYDLLVLGTNSASNTSAFAWRHVAVKGVDVTGLDISLIPLGSIAGRIHFEPDKTINQQCKANIKVAQMTMALKARLNQQDHSPAPQITAFQLESHNLSNESGEFLLSNLAGGLYLLETRLPSKELYIKSITLGPYPAHSIPRKAPGASLNGIRVKPGEQLKGVNIILTEGAAAVHGRVITKGKRPSSIRLYLVPAEREFKDEILRYAEAPILADGSFALSNLAPGRYWVVARPFLNEKGAPFIQPIAWGAKGRAELYGAAESANVLLDLQPCRQLTDYTVSYNPTP
jgi:hypothetical protein